MDALDVCWFLVLFAAAVCCSVQRAVRAKRDPEGDHSGWWAGTCIFGLGTLFFAWPVVTALYEVIEQLIPSPRNPVHGFTSCLITGAALLIYLSALIRVPAFLYHRIFRHVNRPGIRRGRFV